MQLPGSGGNNRHGRRNGPQDRDHKSNAKTSRNGRDNTNQSNTGNHVGQNPHGTQQSKNDPNYQTSAINSYENAPKLHVSINGGDPKMNQSQNYHPVGNSSYIHPQSSLMNSVDASAP